MDVMETLRRRKRALKARVTLLSNNADEEEIVPELAEVLIKRIDELNEKLQGLQEEMAIAAEESEVDEVIGEVMDEIRRLLKARLKVQSYLREVGKQEQGEVKETHRLKEVKLPKIKIPTFSGNYEDWPTFQDLYTSLIHNNTGLSKVEKMHYLKSSVTGEAEQILRHIQVSDANYYMAWDTLNRRFSCKRIIIRAILNKFFGQRKVSAGSAKGIRELLDNTRECLNKLRNQEIEVDTWDPIIIHICVSKLDPESHKEWEEEIGGSEELPTLESFFKFLEKRFRMLEALKPGLISERAFKSTAHVTHTTLQCFCCSQSHPVAECPEFQNQKLEDRWKLVRKRSLCIKCLRPGHRANTCRSKGDASCHKWLQDPKESQGVEVVSHFATKGAVALMATAIVKARDSRGQDHLLRALLDPCSQDSFISEGAAQRLKLQKQSVSGKVSGVGEMTIRLTGAANITIRPRKSSVPELDFSAYVVNKVTSVTPQKRLNLGPWKHLEGLELADPAFDKPGSIDLLLGVDVYSEVILPGIRRGPPGTPVAQQTSLGWILSGSVMDNPRESKEEASSITVSMHLSTNLEDILQKFWDQETIEDKSREEFNQDEAETIYSKTFKRNEEGRYVVKLPFNSASPNLPTNSRKIAIKRWMNLETRLNKNQKIREEYHNVLREYLDLGHMAAVPEEERLTEAVYLPHHAVIREDKDTTKVRVVFDASCKGTNGISLNDSLLVGPRLQEDLWEIILRWRVHRIGFVADVVKMFRQILVEAEDCNYQRIVWREAVNHPVKDYKLQTVTFGTACAPFLAVRTLKQLALDEGDEFPVAKEIVLRDFYMDDLLSGHDTEEGAILLQNQLTALLEKGGFTLQKWTSNSRKFRSEGQPDCSSKTKLIISGRPEIKTLGITWNVLEDELYVTNRELTPQPTWTKRTVLSEIASLFDPLGWMAPSMVLAKCMMQKLWSAGLAWDEEIPLPLKEEWVRLRREIPLLSEVRIHRWIRTSPGNTKLELHGFSDASKSAFAAVVYARVCQPDDKAKVSLIMAKTRVAPLKTVTLPRLELCAAVLLTRLLRRVALALDVPDEEITAWSDAQVVLAWIAKPPEKDVYVQNRIKEIQKFNIRWAYVNTKENPADPASRGLSPRRLLTADLWWKGPNFLREPEIILQPIKMGTLEEVIGTHLALTSEGEPERLLRRYSSYTKLLRVVARIRRWLRVCRKTGPISGPLGLEELREAETTCIKLAQTLEFPEEMESLRKGENVKAGSRLAPLAPFLDNNGIIRVGGRLRHANLQGRRKNPVVLGKGSSLLQLVLREAHAETLHGGPQMLLANLRKKFWILHGGSVARRFVRACVICARHQARPLEQQMGDLPKCRVRPARPFSTAGVDFAGPIALRMSKGRGGKTYKGYICIFVCMSTKAVHVELVSDMTVGTFLAAFKRFVSRRGRCSELWSDHGTTFIGAEKKLLKMWQAGKENIPPELATALTKEKTSWRYIPPHAPHFGGIWEAGVKSLKGHLKKIVGNETLTYEEMITILQQIECCLNSRPLTPMSDDPGDLEVLTPGHFLVGEPLSAVPEPDFLDAKISHLDRWQLTQRLFQHLWRRWQEEYLSRLQSRPKWRKKAQNLTVGDLVLIKETQAPGRWLKGRVQRLHLGADQLARSYDIRTATGIFHRPATKVCVLPKTTDLKGPN